ncbi:hypothetical protein LX64_04398 [Chitinophaga skermanii]|uniref:Uncharacterized protein n=1 Tax=Chitinophaga skermanii TaxID=331697 RepID=A0A327Q5N7_9BACT|nr:hypothetical protein [Chitinophaga skermanii]RAI99845.1 hypothetical protein LX64_04398 [Chitinophaga skermanii]
MPIKRIQPKETTFIYEPQTAYLCIVAGEKFLFDPYTNAFAIDQNPFGEPVLSILTDVFAALDYKQISFDANYRYQPTTFHISSEFHYDYMLFELFATIAQTGFNFNETDTDAIHLHYEDGKLVTLDLHKTTQQQKFLLTRDENGLYYIQEHPWIKERVQTIHWLDDTLVCNTGHAEHHYNFETQDFLLQFLKRIIG